MLTTYTFRLYPTRPQEEKLLCTKAESAGCRVMTVEPRQTSQQCSTCGCIVKKTLAIRVHRCSNCGLTIDRDINAAMNILQKAVGQELPEYAPVEIEPLLSQHITLDGQARSWKQEAQSFRAE